MRTTKALLLCAVVAGLAGSTASPQSQLAKLLPWKRQGGAPSHRSLLTAEELEERKAEEEEKEAEESMFKWTCVVGILSLAATFIGGYVLESNHITRLPEAGVGILIGAAASGVAMQFGNEVMMGQERFDFEFFMVWLLPPIIFEAGFNMNVSAFVNNIGPTMFFAFVGTFASTFVVGGILYYAGQMGLCYPLGLLASLTFGSLISATDPVTVLAVFQVRPRPAPERATAREPVPPPAPPCPSPRLRTAAPRAPSAEPPPCLPRRRSASRSTSSPWSSASRSSTTPWPSC